MLPEVGSTIVPPGLSLPVALGRLDHREPDPVLVRAARVHELELGEDDAGHVLRDAVEPDDRRVADEVDQGWVVVPATAAEAYSGPGRYAAAADSFWRVISSASPDEQERRDEPGDR